MVKLFASPSLAERIVPISSPRGRTVREQFGCTQATQKNSERFAKMRDCLICAESKPVHHNFPRLSTCNHEANTCIDCFIKQATVVIEQHRRWEALTCPACSSAIDREELTLSISRSDATAQAELRRLDDLVKRAALMQSPNWRWCSAGCDHGQIYLPNQVPRSQMVKCGRCRALFCFKHHVKWHQGYTCEEYDLYHPASAITRSNQDIIKKTTKACPHCAWRIQKEGGCSHMICPQCNRTFFWNRLAFDGENQPSSADYAGGPPSQYPALDADIENQIMAMEDDRSIHHLNPASLANPLPPEPRFITSTRRSLFGNLRLPPQPPPEPDFIQGRQDAIGIPIENDPFLRDLLADRGRRRPTFRTNTLSSQSENAEQSVNMVTRRGEDERRRAGMQAERQSSTDEETRVASSWLFRTSRGRRDERRDDALPGLHRIPRSPAFRAPNFQDMVTSLEVPVQEPARRRRNAALEDMRPTADELGASLDTLPSQEKQLLEMQTRRDRNVAFDGVRAGLDTLPALHQEQQVTIRRLQARMLEMMREDQDAVASGHVMTANQTSDTQEDALVRPRR